jgi:hypothetical protein
VRGLSRLAPRRHVMSMVDWLFRADLTRLANKYHTDKGTRFYGGHHYTRFYHQFLSHLRHRPITFLEIGLRHPGNHDASATPSLRMWRDYFSKAQLIGFDIDDFSRVSLPNCCILQGDMGSREDLSKLFALGPFDVVIDDGSHASAHQQIALACLFPHLKSGGFYFIEDLNWRPSALERADVPLTQILLRQKCFASPVITSAEAQYLASNIDTIQLFDTRNVDNQHYRFDALGVIKKVNS